MKIKKRNLLRAAAIAFVLSVSAVGCSATQVGDENIAATLPTAPAQASATQATTAQTASSSASTGETPEAETSVLTASERFTDRDLEQTADLAAATRITLESDTDVTLNTEGVYVLDGEAENTTIMVEAPDDAKVQIVLDGVSIVNSDSPAIYVKAADKVFVTSTASENRLEVTGSYTADGDTNVDAVIFSRADLTLNGTGTLDVVSAEGNGISSKDELKITGGVYTVTSSADGLEANDAILMYDGELTVDAGKDGLHSENEEDASLGYIYIQNGTLTISAADDAIRGNSMVRIDGGTIDIATSEEGIEANDILVNDGQITLYAKNDGLNASPKVDADAAIEVNGGTIDVRMGSGDTDAFDSNGDITVNGGTITVEAASAFDSDGTAQLNGGVVTVNGEVITQITQSRGGGGGGRGMRF